MPANALSLALQTVGPLISCLRMRTQSFERRDLKHLHLEVGRIHRSGGDIAKIGKMWNKNLVSREVGKGTKVREAR